MPHPPVNVKVTFVSTKVGKAPLISIEAPIDISQHIGQLTSKGYNLLKTKINDIVKDPEYNMFFHRDRDHIYHFDESALQHGAIYGRKKRRDEKDGGAK